MYSGLPTWVHMPLRVLKKYTKGFEIKVRFFLLSPEATAPTVWKPFLLRNLSFFHFSIEAFFFTEALYHFCVCSHARRC